MKALAAISAAFLADLYLPINSFKLSSLFDDIEVEASVILL
ncbi:hypothetical protein QP249_25265 [Klebsiella pneumoniae]|nr:hypothetical protein [Klebsiella pneumoniae]MDK6678436.1 hypothetical protein [Klebsiella pneumoniae]MDK8105746.1 hypothetical protein [Klebsiella pneumoniae]